MTNQTNASLIATAKAMREQLGEEPKSWSILALWFETASRLEAAEQRAEEAELERDNWKMSAEEAERAEKRWKDRAVEAERENRQHRKDLAEWEKVHAPAWIDARDRQIAEARAQRNQLAAVVEKALRPENIDYGHVDIAIERVREALTTAPADALREHDAALIEELADEVQNAPTSDPGTAWFNNDMAQWLREKARQRREEQS